MSLKSDLVNTLHEAGKGAVSTLNRKPIATLKGMAAEIDPPAEEVADPRLVALADLLAEVELSAREEVEAKKSYYRVRAQANDGQRWTAYVHPKYIDLVPVRAPELEAAISSMVVRADDARTVQGDRVVRFKR